MKSENFALMMRSAARWRSLVSGCATFLEDERADEEPLPPRGLALRVEALADTGQAGEAYGLLGALKQQQALALRPAGESGLKPSAAALSATLQAALTDKEVVDDGDLRQLALDRSRAMRAVLIEEGGVGEGRVFVLEPESAAGQPGTVISKLTLNAL